MTFLGSNNAFFRGLSWNFLSILNPCDWRGQEFMKSRVSKTGVLHSRSWPEESYVGPFLRSFPGNEAHKLFSVTSLAAESSRPWRILPPPHG